jgi:hypothetical protein
MKRRASVIVTVVAGASAAAIACVLADPPPIPNTLPPPQPPAILSDSVTPSLMAILHALPTDSDAFVVPVLADPDRTLKARVFLDLDPKGAAVQSSLLPEIDSDGGVLGVSGEAGSGIRTITFTLSTSLLLDPSVCHSFTIVVAYDFVSNDFAKPAPPGGTSATWQYMPVSDCTFYDAGVSVSDGGTD